MLDQRGNPRTPQLDVGLRVEAHVRIEADQAFAAFPAYQSQQGVGNRLYHQRKRTDVQAAHLRAQRRQVFRFQLTVSTAFATEAVLWRAIGADRDHGQCCRCGEVHQIVGLYAFILQHLQQSAAEVVGRQPGKQRRVHSQTA
ncbi:hypothetical protein D3C84_740860 [compost metagenome]